MLLLLAFGLFEGTQYFESGRGYPAAQECGVHEFLIRDVTLDQLTKWLPLQRVEMLGRAGGTRLWRITERDS